MLRVYVAATLLLVGRVAAATPLDPADAEQFRRLDLLFNTHGSLEPFTTGAPDRQAAYRAFVRDRMAQDSFYDELLPRLFGLLTVNFLTNLPPAHYALKPVVAGGKTFYHRDSGEPCDPREVVSVHPWWDLNSTVLVCPNDYRPQVKKDPRTTEQFCETNGGGFLDLDGFVCGCGEHLLNCTRDWPQMKQFSKALKLEPLRTMQYVIQQHQRFSRILTMNETVRSDLADLFYRRNRYFNHGTFEMPPLSDDSKPSLRPRDPEFDGGILTTPLFLFWETSRRVIVSYVWEDFLCTPLRSSAVHAEQMFELKDPKLHTHDYIGLASMVGCKDCHARIENAVRALRGFTPTSDGYRFVADRVFRGPISFFVRDANDRRGEGPATPAWLGQMIASQPEFDACMVHKVTELLYGGYPVPEKVTQLLLTHFRHSQDFATLFEDAVVARFAATAPTIETSHVSR